MKAASRTPIGADRSERHAIAAAQKDPARFAELYEDNVNLVYGYIARRVRDRDVAEDLTSDVFQSALASLRRFEWRGAPFASWLIRIAANAIADRSQSLARRAARDRELAIAAECGEGAELADSQNRARLFALVEGLPLAQRQVITMRFAEEKTIKEMALKLGRSEGSIKQLQFRGLQNLRARLGEKNA